MIGLRRFRSSEGAKRLTVGRNAESTLGRARRRELMAVKRTARAARSGRAWRTRVRLTISYRRDRRQPLGVRMRQPPSFRGAHASSFRAEGEESPPRAVPRSLAFARDDERPPLRAADSCHSEAATPRQSEAFAPHYSEASTPRHAEPKARNLRCSRCKDPSASLGMTAPATPSARRARKVVVSRGCIILNEPPGISRPAAPRRSRRAESVRR